MGRSYGTVYCDGSTGVRTTQGPDMKCVLEHYLKLQQKCSRIFPPRTDGNKIRVCGWGVVIHKKTFCVALGVSILWLLRNQDRDFLLRTLLIQSGKFISFFRVRQRHAVTTELRLCPTLVCFTIYCSWCGMTWCDVTWCNAICRDVTWRGVAWRDETVWRDVTW